MTHSFNYTYRELLNSLLKLSEEQLDCDITSYNEETDEYHAAQLTMIITNDDVDILDKDHPVISIRKI